jgi:phosphate transport system substrate-binding protein
MLKIKTLLTILVALTLLSCGSGEKQAATKNITVKGSDTLVRLGQRWAEVYMGKNPGEVIQVSGGGTGTGIAALLNGAVDVCEASRDMKKEEYELAEQKGIHPYRISVALDGIALYVHKDNPVQQLTLDQIKDIYQIKITNWKDVGGPDKEIILYSRENNSGTYAYFKEHVLKDEDFADRVQSLPGTAAVVNAVSKDLYGIGYGGIAWAADVRDLLVKKDDTTAGVAPTIETVTSGSYPISRELYWFTNGKPEGRIKQLVNWVLSAEGQQIADEVGYVRLPEEAAQKAIIQ